MLTNEIADKISLTKTLAGAVLLGIATSVPELTITLRLFKLRNYNIAVGNIVGSNLFNFLILVVADCIAVNKDIYVMPGIEVIQLMICGVISTILFYIMLKFRNKKTLMICNLGIITSYLAFLLW